MSLVLRVQKTEGPVGLPPLPPHEHDPAVGAREERVRPLITGQRDVGMDRALPLGGSALLERCLRGDGHGVGAAGQRADARDPERVAPDHAGEAGDLLGVRRDAGPPQIVHGGARTSVEREGLRVVAGERQERNRRERTEPARSHGDSASATPQGSFPTGTFRVTFRLSVSTTLTSLDGPLAVYKVLPSGVRAMPQGRCPTGITAAIETEGTVTTDTVAPRPV